VNRADDSLAPEYETAATTLKSKGDIKLAKVGLSLFRFFIILYTRLACHVTPSDGC
jgi:hypothetical protein